MQRLPILGFLVIGCSSLQAPVQPIESSAESFLDRAIQLAAPRKRPSGSLQTPFSPREQLETLRVVGPEGATCAAVALASRLAVTALHCVRGPLGSQVLGEDRRGQTNDAKLVAISGQDLVALLEFDKPLTYGRMSCDNPRGSEKVHTIGHPEGETWVTSYGWLTHDPITLEWPYGDRTKILVAQIPTKQGSSGGGLFDSREYLIGIQIARFSPWTKSFGKAAFVQSTRVFSVAGTYCSNKGSDACKGLKCSSSYYDLGAYSAL